MKIQVLSDLHLEFENFEYQETDADIVILAGDIAIGADGLDWAYKNIPEEKLVVYVAGNHEFYGGVYEKTLNSLWDRAEKYGIAFLENSSFILGNVKFIGCTLWANLEGSLGASRKQAIQEGKNIANDYKLIKTVNINGRKRKLTPTDTLRFHTRSINYIKNELSNLPKIVEKTVVITHHSPSLSLNLPNKEYGIGSAFFVSDLEPFIKEYQPDYWIHGHTHYNTSKKIGKTLAFSNQRGYAKSESVKNFNPRFVIDV